MLFYRDMQSSLGPCGLGWLNQIAVSHVALVFGSLKRDWSLSRVSVTNYRYLAVVVLIFL